MARVFRTALIVLLSLVMLVAGLVLGPGREASAQGPTFAILTGVPVASACPAETTDIGITIVPGITFGDGTSSRRVCEPDGFIVVPTQDVCEQSQPSEWIAHPTLPAVCSTGTGFGPVPPTQTCPLGFARAGAPAAVRVDDEAWCVLGVYVDSTSVDSLLTSTAGYPICVESGFALEHANDLAVGSPFVVEGHDYFIHTGPPTCEVNCHGGFDFNCDDVLGDYCPAELDLTRVSGVHDCLAAMAPSAVDAALGDAAAVPAIPAIPVADDGGAALAHTGSESALFAFIGAGLLGFGTTAMGMRRRLSN